MNFKTVITLPLQNLYKQNLPLILSAVKAQQLMKYKLTFGISLFAYN